MVKLILGVKGSGKTKRLVEMVCAAVESENGDVICIEKDKKLTYDIPHRARLIDAAEYGINSYDLFKGFLCGIHSGNYDITHFFIDNFFKIVGDYSTENFEKFVTWLDSYSATENIEFVISGSVDPADMPEAVKKFVI